jgi:YD repeat-containing protein
LTSNPTENYAYDDLGRTISVSRTTGGVTTMQHEYGYTPRGQLGSWKYGQFTTVYRYDAGGNLESVVRNVHTPPAGTNTPTQDAAVQTCVTNINSASCASDIRPVLRAWAVPFPATANFTATPANLLVSRWMSNHDLPVRTYTHNAKGQLTALTEPLQSANNHLYTYDSRGNRSATTAPPAPTTTRTASRRSCQAALPTQSTTATTAGCSATPTARTSHASNTTPTGA